MYLRRDCAAGVRFLAAVKAGCGVKPSARAAGVGKQTAYRWLRESFTELREHGVSVGCPGRAGLLLAAGCWSGSSTAWSGRSARDTTGRSTSIVRTRSGGASWLAAASRKLARPRVSAATAPGAETRPVRGGRAFTVEVRLTGIVGGPVPHAAGPHRPRPVPADDGRYNFRGAARIGSLPLEPDGSSARCAAAVVTGLSSSRWSYELRPRLSVEETSLVAEGVVMTAGPSAADSRRMTSREVAARAGVSQATVSNVLNRPHLVAEVTRERVRAVIEEHGFAVHDGARRLRAGRSTQSRSRCWIRATRSGAS